MKHYVKIREYYHSYLNLDEDYDYIIDLILAARISLRFDNPLWIAVQATSSSGKTEIMKMLDSDDSTHFLTDITPKTLFSGYQAANGGFIPRQVKEKGLLCFPDFTTVLSQNTNNLSAIMSQLRVAYDGKASRRTGMDVAAVKDWEGKIGVLLAVTNAIEDFKKKASSLGERFIYFRHRVPSFDADTYCEGVKPDKFPKKSLSKLLKNAEKRKPVLCEPGMSAIINHAAELVSKCRTAVIRNHYTKEIEFKNEPEEPYRLRAQFKTLVETLSILHGGITQRTISILQEIVHGSIPLDRFYVLNELYMENEILNKDIRELLGYNPSRVTHLLQDMEAIGIVEKYSKGLAASEQIRDSWQVVFNEKAEFSEY